MKIRKSEGDVFTMDQTTNQTTQPAAPVAPTKFCKHCGAKIPVDAVICTACGRQVEELRGQSAQPNIVINNSNQNSNQNVMYAGRAGKEKNKWVALILCLLLGFFGAHKFYEGKIGMGILYLFTGGLFCIGVVIDFFSLLFKPNPYYV